ncbi:radical SAM protein [bacterium]|nr:radical SAM protein [bacterium]
MSAPRVTFVNPPFRRRVQRRFTASYFAPNFLMPPTDLLYAASSARAFAGAATHVLDAVAKSWTRESAIARVAETAPDVVFAQLGFATIEDDLEFCRGVRAATGARVVAMGYLPTVMPREVMEHSDLDAIVLGEPEIAFAELLNAWSNGGAADDVAGVWTRRGDAIVEGPPAKPVPNFDDLPFPDHAAVDANDYSEVLVGRRLAALFTARGCPYPCTFCVRTFGRRLSKRSAESVLTEARHVIRDLGIRNLRFMDDTFNIDEARAIAICEGLAAEGRLAWSALARIDHVTPASAQAMGRAGCKRVYVGVESGAQGVVDGYKKGLDLAAVAPGVKTMHDAGIEVSAFFIVGDPAETREDFEESVRLASRAKVDFVIVTRLQYHPGTALFDERRDQIDHPTPFEFVPRDRDAYARVLGREREFYRRFYLRPGYVLRRLSRILSHPRDALESLMRLGSFLLRPPKEDFI